MKNNGFVRYFIFILLSFIVFPAGESFGESKRTLIVFHAGSLAVPFRELAEIYMKNSPGLQIHMEAAGSRTCARKISDLKRTCDVMASADYTVIETLLMPNYADWNLSFATNEMAIMFRPDSRYSSEINGENWYRILLRDGVEYGHSDPNSDPCGYRSQLVWQLAEIYYNEPGLYQKLREDCPPRNVRPKETDLIALLETGQIDYVFIYRSVCEQHNMPYVILPDRINLKKSEYDDFYKNAGIKITGTEPGEFIEKRGKSMVYGITIPRNNQNLDSAIEFVAFIVGPRGSEIMSRNGQPPISPPIVSGRVDLLPYKLKKLVK